MLFKTKGFIFNTDDIRAVFSEERGWTTIRYKDNEKISYKIDYDSFCEAFDKAINPPKQTEDIRPAIPIFNKKELEKALAFYRDNCININEGFKWCAINCIRYCLDHLSKDPEEV